MKLFLSYLKHRAGVISVFAESSRGTAPYSRKSAASFCPFDDVCVGQISRKGLTQAVITHKGGEYFL